MEHREVGPEGLEVERSRDVERVEQADSVGERERRERGRERVVIEKRDALLRCERESIEDAVCEVGVGGEVRHADRAERPHARRRAVVETGDEMLEQLEAHARASARKRVRHHEELRAHDVVGRRVALADAVLEDEAVVELAELGRRDHRALANPDAGREAVHRSRTGERGVDDVAPGADALGDAGCELDRFTASRDANDVLEGERVAGELHGHPG